MSHYAPSHYETIAASQTDQVMGNAGAAGDFLDTLICVVATAATSTVSLKDGGGSSISILPAAVGQGIGTYSIPVRMRSQAGPWKVTTGAGVSVIAVGNFT
jgi:hypothetical protein